MIPPASPSLNSWLNSSDALQVGGLSIPAPPLRPDSSDSYRVFGLGGDRHMAFVAWRTPDFGIDLYSFLIEGDSYTSFPLKSFSGGYAFEASNRQSLAFHYADEQGIFLLSFEMYHVGYRGEWSHVGSYEIGDKVEHWGRYYVAIAPSNALDPKMPNDPSSSSYWDVLLSKPMSHMVVGVSVTTSGEMSEIWVNEFDHETFPGRHWGVPSLFGVVDSSAGRVVYTTNGAAALLSQDESDVVRAVSKYGTWSYVRDRFVVHNGDFVFFYSESLEPQGDEEAFSLIDPLLIGGSNPAVYPSFAMFVPWCSRGTLAIWSEDPWTHGSLFLQEVDQQWNLIGEKYKLADFYEGGVT